MMPKIQVLMSTYNGEKYLSEMINSILNQNLVEISLLIRDDGSSDSTLLILQRYAKTYKNITFYQGKNLGFAESFWDLVKEAGGSDYYAFCDQDDVWFSDKLITAIDKLTINQPSDVPILYTGNVVEVDHNLNVINEVGFKVTDVLSYADSLKKSILPGCTFVFNNRLLQKLKMYSGKHISHDWTTYIVATALGKVIYDETPHMFYRIHSNNTIGIESKLKCLTNKIKRFFKPSFPNSRSVVAKNIYNTYGIR